jgi:hypothetical protein
MDERYSLWDIELGASTQGERTSFVNRWVDQQPKLDPSPREEIARTFFADSIRARMNLH